MQINITLDGSETPLELNAVGAMIDVLAGRDPRYLDPRRPAPNAPITSTSQSGPVVQPTPTVPTPPAPVPVADEIDEATIAGAPDRDTAGFPWDERIHSASRATVADGTWRKRRNVPDEEYERVMIELEKAIDTSSTQEVPAAADVPPPPSTETPPPPTTVPEPVVTAPAAAAATTAADVPPPPPAAGAKPIEDMTWPEFVQHVQNKPDVPETAKVYNALNVISETFDVKRFIDMKDKKTSWALFYDMVG